MSFNTTTPTTPATPAAEKQTPERIATAIAWLRQGWTAQAFSLLSEPPTPTNTTTPTPTPAPVDKPPAARFALGLCHLRAGDLPSAITCMEQSHRQLAAISAPSREPTETNETHHRLSAAQIAEKIYLTPMDTDFCARFPKTAAQMVMLALIHTYQKNNMPDQARRLAAALTGPIFEEYKKKLTENMPIS